MRANPSVFTLVMPRIYDVTIVSSSSFLDAWVCLGAPWSSGCSTQPPTGLLLLPKPENSCSINEV